jgi:hypothetical protein
MAAEMTGAEIVAAVNVEMEAAAAGRRIGDVIGTGMVLRGDRDGLRAAILAVESLLENDLGGPAVRGTHQTLHEALERLDEAAIEAARDQACGLVAEALERGGARRLQRDGETVVAMAANGVLLRVTVAAFMEEV